MINKIHINESLSEVNYKSIAAAAMMGASSFLPGTTSAAEKPVTANIQKVTFPYTVEDIVAATLTDEAGGERNADEGMHAVLNVIMTRGKGNMRSAAAACLVPKQFSGWNPVNKTDVDSVKRFISEKKKHSKYAAAMALVMDAKAGKLKDITGGSDHFLNIELTKAQSKNGKLPKWVDMKKVTKIFGKHTFLKLK